VPARIFRRAQQRVAMLVDQALPADARVVIDVGCGPGWLAIGLAKRRPEIRVNAIDLSATMLGIAYRNAQGVGNITFLLENAAKLSAQDQSADMIVSSESMHHWRDPVAVLNELYRVLKPGGRVWIFDGRDDFDASEAQEWIPTAPTLFGINPLMKLQRAMLHVHGFSNEEWNTLVPGWAKQSQFGEGTIERCGIYSRLELKRQARP
jgi:ubiquinone/menaquinone biosynthesis C-methylase UbiE